MTIDLTGRRVLDRYVVDSLLASGGMGTVWRAHHETLGQPVAIKVVTQTADADLRQRIAREARVMALVRHPHVVSILDAGLFDGAIVIAMEWLEGETMADRLTRDGAMPWRVAAALGAELALGLAAVHRANLVHRDLKPMNVMLCGKSPEVVKLLDLGLARPVEAENKLTMGNMVLGTPAYMAPEQLLAQPLDGRADLYSLGIVLYELVTGEIPWRDPSIAAAFRRTRETLPRPVVPSTLPQLPLPVLQLMSSLLAANPAGRPSSAMEVADRLLEALGAQAPGPPTTPRREPVGAPTPASETDRTVVRAGRAEPGSSSAAETAQTLLRPGRKEPPRGDPELPRTRHLVVASLPASRLSRPLVRKALAGMLKGHGRSFTFGERLWLALLVGAEGRETARRADELCVRLRQEFGDSAEVVMGPADEGFVLTTAALTGTAPLPPSLDRLISSLGS